MEQAIDSLKRYGDEMNINIVPIYIEKQDKVFSRNIFVDNIKERECLKKLSQELEIPRGDRLGYKNSESLVAFYNNTPNNTLGLIRYEKPSHNYLYCNIIFC